MVHYLLDHSGAADQASKHADLVEAVLTAVESYLEWAPVQ